MSIIPRTSWRQKSDPPEWSSWPWRPPPTKLSLSEGEIIQLDFDSQVCCDKTILCCKEFFCWGAYRDIFHTSALLSYKKRTQSDKQVVKKYSEKRFSFFCLELQFSIFFPSNDLISINSHLVAKHLSFIKSMVQQ
jgi:hypothetical protein